MDRWMVLRKQVRSRTPEPIPQNLRELPQAPAPGIDGHPYATSEPKHADIDWLRGALWMLAGYLLLRLLEGGVRAARPAEPARRPVGA